MTVENYNSLPLGPGVHILNSSKEGLIALYKPTGVLSHPNICDETHRSLLNADYNYDDEVYVYRNEGMKCHVWLINRLDSPTSGIILVAVNSDVAKLVKLQFANHKVAKTYYALVKHRMKSIKGNWIDQITRSVHNKRINRPNTITAKTRFQAIKSPNGGFPITLLKLFPLTGRNHQLRVQCQLHGHPIVGDRTYGSFSFNREVAKETGKRRLMLHCAETSVSYFQNGKMINFIAKAALPEDFQDVLRFRLGTRRVHDEINKKSLKDKLAGRRFRK
ncbi:MAG: RNA pseudouridine synthase [Verrucomicrobiota bacterium]|nr:RNA pseudouridine synthase [Verrucomicrobiota bacterium]